MKGENMIITVDSMEIYRHKDHNALNKVEMYALAYSGSF